MTLRFLKKLPGRALQAALVVLLAGVVLFFGLTRTQVGRDQLRDELEDQFNERFAGSLEIGRLTGNLVGTLYAADVRLSGPEGRPVASVDSIRIVPRWRSLLSQTVFLQSVELMRPQFHLVRRSDATWNIAEALRRQPPRSPASSSAAPAVRLPDVYVRDGRIQTEGRGPAPPLTRNGWLFDYADARATDVNTHFRLERPPDQPLQVNLSSFSGTLADPNVRIETLKGQLIVGQDRLTLDDLNLRLDETKLRGSAALGETIRLDLQASRLKGREIRRLVPRWPLSGTITAALEAHGTPDRLSIDRLRLKRGSTDLRAAGTLRDLFDDPAFDLQLTDSHVTARDLRAVLPAAPDAPMNRLARLGHVQFSLGATGAATLDNGPPAFTTQLQLNAQSDIGAARGIAQITRKPGQPLQYNADLHADSLNVARLTETDALPRRLTGSVKIDGEGTSAHAFSGTVEAHLKRFVLDGRSVDAFTANLRADADRLSGTFALRQRRSSLRGVLTLDHSTPRPTYQVRATADQLDLGPLLQDPGLTTCLNAQIDAEATGASLGTLAGTLTIAFDSSSVRRGPAVRHVPAHQTKLVLASPSTTPGKPHLRLTSNVADLKATGEVNLSALRALGRLWGPAFSDAARHAWDKPYAARNASATSSPPSEVARPDPARQEAARVALRTAGLGPTIALQSTLTLKRPQLLALLVPKAAPALHPLSAQVALRAGADELSADGLISSKELHAGRLRVSNLEGQFRTRASLGAPLVQTLTASFNAQADSMRLGPATFHTPALATSYQDRSGNVQLSTGTAGGYRKLHLEAGLELLPTRNRLTLHDLHLSAGNYVWTNPRPQPVDLYADAVDIPGVRLTSTGLDAPSQPSGLQSVRVHGTLSKAPRDTVFVDAEGVLLQSISQVTALKRPLGGLLSTQLALTGGLEHPELTGRLAVERFSFDDHLLGRLEAQSRYVPSSPGVSLRASLTPATRHVPLRPDRSVPLQSSESQLSVQGSFKLPGFGSPSSSNGALDLSFNIDRADVFFFEYIFEDNIANAEGFITGSGTIRGRPRRPLFDTQLQIRDGQFDIPRFNLSYEAEGSVNVDKEGIHIASGRVRDAEGGSADVRGSLLFNDYKYFSFDLSASLDQLQIIDVTETQTASQGNLPFYGSIQASGPASLTGPLYHARLRSSRVRTASESELFIPIEKDANKTDAGFLVFADSTGRLPDLERLAHRRNVLADRPAGERSFVDGMDIDLNIDAPEGSQVHLVFDPLLGDALTAVGSGRIQLQRREGQVRTYGTFEVETGRYLFTAGEVFQRRFQITGGTITWDGDPADAQLDLTASYRTRASIAGLQKSAGSPSGRLPIIVQLAVTGRVSQPKVDLSLDVDRSTRGFVSEYAGTALETILNQSDRESEYATSVLLTNTFLLTTDLPQRDERSFSETGNRLAFHSVSQLVSTQLNRYISEALPNLDVNLGVQGGQSQQDLDVSYGVALRLLDERLIIRGEGILNESRRQNSTDEGPREFEGEFVVEVRMTPGVSAEAFYRREGSLLTDQALTSTTGAGLSYQTEFSTWDRLWRRLFGWLLPDKEEPPPEGDAVAADSGGPASSKE